MPHNLKIQDLPITKDSDFLPVKDFEKNTREKNGNCWTWAAASVVLTSWLFKILGFSQLSSPRSLFDALITFYTMATRLKFCGIILYTFLCYITFNLVYCMIAIRTPKRCFADTLRAWLVLRPESAVPSQLTFFPQFCCITTYFISCGCYLYLLQKISFFIILLYHSLFHLIDGCYRIFFVLFKSYVTFYV